MTEFAFLICCERVIWLHEGKLRRSGPAKYIAENYLQYTLAKRGSTVEPQGAKTIDRARKERPKDFQAPRIPEDAA